MKNILFTLIVTIFAISKTGFSCDEACIEAKIAPLKKIIAIQQARLERTEKSRFAIGSIQQSFLTLEQFQKQMGKGWVLCDGSPLPRNSLYKTLGYGETLPNCQGKFIRTLGGNSAPLGKSQEDATAINRLEVSSKSITNRTSNSTVSVSGKYNSGHPTGHFDKTRSYGTTADGGSWAKRVMVGGHDGTHYKFDMNATGTATGGTWKTTTTTELKSTDIETRPINITINTFIKIN